MNINYFFSKIIFKKFLSKVLILGIIGLFIVLLKQEFDSLSPAATRIFNSISMFK